MDSARLFRGVVDALRRPTPSPSLSGRGVSAILILPRQGEVAPKATVGAGNETDVAAVLPLRLAAPDTSPWPGGD